MSLNTKFKLLFSKMSPAEKKIVEITAADVAWGPTTDQMDEIVQLSRSYENRSAILAKIFSFFDINNDKIQWKQVYKNLLLVEHMCIHADMECVQYFKQHIYEIERLKNQYRYKDKQGVDKGINVRKRAETVSELINDEDLEEKRREGQAQKSKYSHTISNVSGQYHAGGTGGYGSGGFGSGTSGFGSNNAPQTYNASQKYQAPSQGSFGGWGSGQAQQAQVMQPAPQTQAQTWQQPQPTSQWQQNWQMAQPAPPQAVAQPAPVQPVQPAPAQTGAPLNSMLQWQQTPGQTSQTVEAWQPTVPVATQAAQPSQPVQPPAASTGDFFSDLFSAPAAGSAPVQQAPAPAIPADPTQAKQAAAMMDLLDF